MPETEPTTTPASHSRLKRWLIGSSIVLVLVLLIGFILHRWMNGSSTGTVQVGSSAQSTTQPSTPLPIHTAYFDTVVPANFTIRQQRETPTASTKQLALVANGGDNQQLQFAATVGTLPSEGLTGIGDYNLRATDATSYKRFVPPSLPSGAVAYRTTSGASNFVVFWPHGSQYIELAFSTDGGATFDQLQELYTYVLAQWSWK